MIMANLEKKIVLFKGEKHFSKNNHIGPKGQIFS